MMRKGQGEPLLFLHGASGAQRWLPFMESLSQSHDVIVPEHPGFGASEMPEWLDNVADLAHFYRDLMDHLGLDKVHLVGTSLGGWIAAELATCSCEKLKSLTLVAPAGLSVPGVRRPDMFMWSPEELRRTLFHDPELAKSAPMPAAEEEVMLAMKNRLTTAKLGWSTRMHNPHLRKWLHRIKVPTLIIWGDDDQVAEDGGAGVAWGGLDRPDGGEVFRGEVGGEGGGLPEAGAVGATPLGPVVGEGREGEGREGKKKAAV
jgi:pimeloyl-ACP methyl ester carboxylesterase